MFMKTLNVVMENFEFDRVQAITIVNCFYNIDTKEKNNRCYTFYLFFFIHIACDILDFTLTSFQHSTY